MQKQIQRLKIIHNKQLNIYRIKRNLRLLTKNNQYENYEFFGFCLYYFYLDFNTIS